MSMVKTKAVVPAWFVTNSQLRQINTRVTKLHLTK